MPTPLLADVTLPRRARSVGQARHALTALVSDLRTADNAALLISEAVANAVEHSRGPSVRIVIRHDHHSGEVLCQVRDSSPDLPAPRDTPAPVNDENGRGLHLITALSDAWGFEREPDGKHLWFRLSPGPYPGPAAG
ncbi:ATP-binding protein [Kitasatospora sp. NPDC059571]|uniref:ATP-binding protein n=1 Tax=Kitasatospora sp. NPDC059571 TaxID=3346871 RepID=UPI0036C6070C